MEREHRAVTRSFLGLAKTMCINCMGIAGNAGTWIQVQSNSEMLRKVCIPMTKCLGKLMVNLAIVASKTAVAFESQQGGKETRQYITSRQSNEHTSLSILPTRTRR